MPALPGRGAAHRGAAKEGAFTGIDVTAVATGTNAGCPNYPPSAWLEAELAVPRDGRQHVATAAANAYGLTALPYFVFVDADGKVAARGTGEITRRPDHRLT